MKNKGVLCDPKYLLPANPREAPRKKLRGRRRYFRRLLRKAESLNLDFSESSWFDMWHHHPDWDGYGNLSWRMRARHLGILAELFKRLAGQLVHFSRPYQLWIYLNAGDSAQDAVFVHSPNPNRDNFPYIPDVLESDIRDVTAFFEALLPGLRLRTIKMRWLGADIYLVYSPDIGVPLLREPAGQ